MKFWHPTFTFWCNNARWNYFVTNSPKSVNINKVQSNCMPLNACTFKKMKIVLLPTCVRGIEGLI